MGTSLDSRDDRHAYIGYVFQNLNAFVMNLAPNAGIGGSAERRPIDINNERPTVAVELSDQYAFGVARQLQITIGGEVVILMCLHSIFLSLFERLPNIFIGSCV